MTDQIEVNNKVDVESEVDVLISGAGPVGLTMAVLLAQSGINFKIIEKLNSRLEYSRAFAIHSRTQEIFEQLGIVNKIKQAGKVGPPSGVMYKNGEEIFQFKLPPSNSPHPYVVGLVQSETERILEARLNDLGHQVLYSSELESLEKNDLSSRFNSAMINHSNNNTKERIQFKYLIGCDGGRSQVRKSSDIKFVGESIKLQITCVDAIVDSDFNSEPFGTILIDGQDMLLMLWVKKDYIRFVFRKQEDKEEITDEEFHELTKKLASPKKLILKEILWKSTFSVNECRAEAHYKDNVFLCGDAAHTHSPAGGQGMNTGIQDAYNLAWKLSLIIKGIGKEDILKDNFNEERSSVAKMVIRNSGLAIRNAFAPTNMVTSFLRRNFIPFLLSFQFVQAQAVETLSEIGIEYNDNTLIKKYSPGWLTNTKIPAVGLRVADDELVNIINSDILSIHKALSGKDVFELFIYLPEDLLHYKGFNKLKEFIKELTSNEEYLAIQDKMKGSVKLSFVLSQYMFNIQQWGHYIESKVLDVNIEDLKVIQNQFESNATYLDVKKWGLNNYSFSTENPTFFIIRPDAYVGLNHSFKNLQPVVEYFNTFLKD